MLKRALDLLVSTIGLVLLSPLLVMVAIAIRSESAGPVFFRQERVGRHGRLFRIFKFRTMSHGRATEGSPLTVAGDARITRVGAWLRRTKLDELPQLIDVLRGTMSLVGPRPEVPQFVAHYPAPTRERVLSVRPGITDLASLRYHDENGILARAIDPEQAYVDLILPAKLRYAMHYVEHASVAGDLRVLGLTLRTIFVPTLFLGRGPRAMNHSRLWAWLDASMAAHRPSRRWLAMLADGLIVLACWQATYLFRLGFEGWQPGRPWYDDAVSIGVVAAYLVCLSLAGVRRSVWRFFGFDDLKRVTTACLFAGLLSAAVVSMAQLTGVARAVLLLHPLFCIAALSMARMIYRMLWEDARARVNGAEGEPRRAIVLGAGEAARRLVAGVHLREGWSVLGMLDDDPSRQGLRIGGISVLGTLADLALPHIREGATHVILAMPDATPEQRDEALAVAKESGLLVLTVPGESELRGVL